MRCSWILSALVVVWLVPAAVAQEAGPRRADAVRHLAPEARARVVEHDPRVRFTTRPVPGGRVDVASGVLRAEYQAVGAASLARAAAPEVTAQRYLARRAAAFGWTPEVSDLELASVHRTPYSSHVVFRQTYRGVPVFNRTVKVNLDADGRPVMVFSGYAPDVAAQPALRVVPTLEADAAVARAGAVVSKAPVRAAAPELVVVPDAPPRLAWKVIVWPTDYPAEWEVLVDAHDGTLIQLMDLSTHAGKGHGAHAPASAEAPGSATPPATAAGTVSGTGFVFDPNPLAGAGVVYGGAYVDAGDADTPVLTEALREVALPGITQGADGLYRLEGPHVRIVGDASIGIAAYTPPAEPTPDGFRYTRSNPFFEAVNAYYHIDASQRYVQALEVGDIQKTGVRVNPHGLGAFDDSKYYTSLNAIAFGLGGVDDAEDADVVLHEYGHALLEASAPGLLRSPEGRALHEGWADYWAASYSRRQVEAGKAGRTDWQTLMEWDSGDGTLWSGRSLGRSGRYPQDTRCDDSFSCNIYEDGLLWATTLMELWDALGRDTQGRVITDRLTLFSHAYLSHPVTMADAAQALVRADSALYGGAHIDVLYQVLSARGFLEAVAAPILMHEPLASTEQQGGTVRLRTRVVGTAIASVTVTYGYDTDTPTIALPLVAEGDGVYAADLPLPETGGEVAYYLTATSDQGGQARLPADGTVYRFFAGPDGIPPLILHEPLRQTPVTAWPPEVVADVRDDAGVDSVWVVFAIEDATGTEREQGAFGLVFDGDQYRGTFPLVKVDEGDLLRYRLFARDGAAAKNEATLPGEGTFDVRIGSRGVLQAYDFETATAFAATGVWAQGVPTFGLRVARSGEQVWATAPQTTYPAEAGVSSLTMPALNLDGYAHVALVFWHWYDLEHNGTASPDGDGSALLWDGANVKVSTDGGATWTVLTPMLPAGGYTGTINEAYGNPLGGQPGFGGYSYGWRLAAFELPTGPDVRVRFDLGTDDSNQDVARDYAGWYLDDIRIVTYPDTLWSVLPDEAPPSVLEAPAAEVVVPRGVVSLPVSVRVGDDVGIDGVWVDYEVQAATPRTGTLRLAMAPTDAATYTGLLEPAGTLAAGDEIRYRLRVRDAYGREITYPAAEAPPLRAEVRLIAQADALAEVRATGAWQSFDGLWSASPGFEAGTRSSLVLQPADLPVDADVLRLTLRHRFTLGAGLGGNVKVSTDDGRTWVPLEPIGGYQAVLEAEDHPMAGEPVFQGTSHGDADALFDLSPYAGRQIRLRVDLGATRDLEVGEFWTLEAATLYFDTRTPGDDDFTVPRTLTLHANYPDPFATTTTLGYTLPRAVPVRLEVYDLLGRRVALLVDAEQAEGTYTLTFDGSRLASGVYLLRLTTGARQHVERMVIAR